MRIVNENGIRAEKEIMGESGRSMESRRRNDAQSGRAEMRVSILCGGLALHPEGRIATSLRRVATRDALVRRLRRRQTLAVPLGTGQRATIIEATAIGADLAKAAATGRGTDTRRNTGSARSARRRRRRTDEAC